MMKKCCKAAIYYYTAFPQILDLPLTFFTVVDLGGLKGHICKR